MMFFPPEGSMVAASAGSWAQSWPAMGNAAPDVASTREDSK
jgi:hypothetical protein